MVHSQKCWAILMMWSLGAAVGCGGRANPVGPSEEVGASNVLETRSDGAALPGGVLGAAAAGPLSPAHFEARGWSCFQPLPSRIVCSGPGQGFPEFVPPPGEPPDDRPATFTFLVFDAAHRFVGTETLIRTDLYRGQICASTDAPYDLVPPIGYYECVHIAAAERRAGSR